MLLTVLNNYISILLIHAMILLKESIVSSSSSSKFTRIKWHWNLVSSLKRSRSNDIDTYILISQFWLTIDIDIKDIIQQCASWYDVRYDVRYDVSQIISKIHCYLKRLRKNFLVDQLINKIIFKSNTLIKN